MAYGLKSIPRSEFGAGFSVLGSDLFNLGIQQDKATFPTIATAAGTTEGDLIRAPFAGTIVAVSFSAKDALAADNTNFVAWGIINKGATGAGSTQMLTTSPAGVNTTKVTGGTALAAYERHVLTPTTIAVAAGDILLPTVVASGTLANTITKGVMHILFLPS